MGDFHYLCDMYQHFITFSQHSSYEFIGLKACSSHLVEF